MDIGWGDEVILDDFLPPKEEVGPDESGITTITEYRRRDDGKKEKVVTRVKTVVVKTKITPAMRRRKKLPRFGLAAGGQTENVTIISVDEVPIDRPGKSTDQDTANLVDSLTKAIGKSKGGAESNSFWAKKRENFTVSGIGADGQPGRYVPPVKRSGAALPERDDSCTLRVSNLSPDTRDADVQELFRSFGPLARVYLAKDRVTHESRGFAFVSFHSKSDAKKAMEKLDGYPYDHLILRVEWAKPSKPKDPGSMGGLSSGYTSGYGKALPQDVKK